MKVLLAFSLLGILYTYAGYPVAIWMLARLRPRPWRTAPVTPSVSIVLAVHNGALLLPRKIRDLCALDCPNIHEIIIVSDGSTDGTNELLMQQREPRLKIILLKEQAGKAVAVNAGIAAATAEVILFVDIRPEIAPGAMQQLLSNFADPQVGCVSGGLNLRQEGHDPAASAITSLYWRYEQWTRRSESLCHSPVGVYGGFYAIRRELAVPLPAGIILDDLFQPLSVIRQGYRSILDPRACVYDVWPKSARDEFHRKVRTLAGNFQLIQLAPWTLTPQNKILFQLASHKLMRLVVPYLAVLSLVSMLALSRVSIVYPAIAVLQILGLLLGVAGLRFRILGLQWIASPASALLILNAAAVLGFYKFLFTPGPLWKIWTATPAGKAKRAAGMPKPPVSVVPAVGRSTSVYAEAAQPAEAQDAVAIR